MITLLIKKNLDALEPSLHINKERKPTVMHPKKLYTFWKLLNIGKKEYRKRINTTERRYQNGYQVLSATERAANREKPDLVGSLTPEGLHRLAVDIDFPARLVPSRTVGHYHLYLDGMTPINFHKYVALLRALVAAGIIEEGYAEVSIKRGMTMLRYNALSLPDDVDKSLMEDLTQGESIPEGYVLSYNRKSDKRFYG